MCLEQKICNLCHPQTPVRLLPPRQSQGRILNFKTTWSEFQKASQTATERGEAELCILNFKTICSEFQISCQSAVM